MISSRQQKVLKLVVQRNVETGVPVGSKALSQSLEWGPSTIRAELASLESQGLLDHPHTSAGRVPTELGFRYFVDRVLTERLDEQPEFGLDDARRELDEAMRCAAAQLAGATQLLAVITAPPIDTSTVRHVELLALQPQVLAIVVITSTGGISKRVMALDGQIDSGIIKWAASFLNERLHGAGLGSRMIRKRLEEEALGPREREFLELIAPAFTELSGAESDHLFFDGASELVNRQRGDDRGSLESVVEMLERRIELLAALREAVSEPDVLVRIGHENESPAMHSLGLVASTYGPPRGSVGTVSVLGPVRMDYRRAIAAVRAASQELSRFVEDVYDGR